MLLDPYTFDRKIQGEDQGAEQVVGVQAVTTRVPISTLKDDKSFIKLPIKVRLLALGTLLTMIIPSALNAVSQVILRFYVTLMLVVVIVDLDRVERVRH